MGNWREYTQDAAAAASPYLKRAETYVEDAAGRLNHGYRRLRRRRARGKRLLRLKQVLDMLTGLVLLAAAGLALYTVLRDAWKAERD